MASQAIESHRENAEVTYGDEICYEKIQETLKEFELPNGLLPLKDILEVGINRKTGFVWAKQTKSTIHVFSAIGKTISYAQEITAFIEKGKLKKITGVKSRELLLWISLDDIYINENDCEMITGKNTMSGIGLSFPSSAFQLEEEKMEGGVY
ncbi:hypothetical protein ACHQM5_004471 [Ranunculus cassubicifolius]